MKRSFQFVLSVSVALGTFALPAQTYSAPGDLYVSDSGGTIFKFTSAGTKGTFVSGLEGAGGLAFDRAGNLFVVSGGGTILKFTPDGSKSTFASGLSSPSALAFDGMGNLYVTESFGDIGDISKFTPAGVKSTFASDGNLTGLAFDLSGNLFASHRGATDLGGGIIKFTPDGKGSEFAPLTGPGMAVSASGSLFTPFRSSINDEPRIIEFTPTGSASFFTSEVDEPGGLAFDGAGNLFLVDFSSRSIFKFTPDAQKSTFATGLDHPGFLAFEPFTEKLRNISARGLVGTADEGLIGGFIVGGSGLANNAVVARAIGPSLTGLGVRNALQDPVLELHNASGALIASNDDWQETQKDQIEASGLAPNDPREAAIFATLPAGDFTAVVRGVGDTTGIALVEIYSVQQ